MVGGRTISNAGNNVMPSVGDNPMFKFKIVNIDHRMEQQSGKEKPSEETLTKGEPIQGVEVGSKKSHRGRIQELTKDEEGNILNVMITNEKGVNVKIDPTSIKKLDLNDESLKNTIEESANRKVLLFEQWIASK